MRIHPVLLVVAVLCAASGSQAQDERIVAFCDKLFECGLEPVAADCVTNSVTSDTNARGVNDPICTEYADAEIVWMGCIATKNCSALNGCDAEDAPRQELEQQGATACGNGAPPLAPPAGWQCDPGNFNSGDGCDCGCGEPDLDCGGTGCGPASCNADGCGFCHDDDTDLFTCGGTPGNDGFDNDDGGNSGFSTGSDDRGAADGGAGGVPVCGSNGSAPLAGLAAVAALLLLRRRRR